MCGYERQIDMKIDTTHMQRVMIDGGMYTYGFMQGLCMYKIVQAGKYFTHQGMHIASRCILFCQPWQEGSTAI